MVNSKDQTNPAQKSKGAQSMTVMQAIAQSSTLGGLLSRMDSANQALLVIQDLLPLGLRQTVKAGPVAQGVWTLLVNTSSATAKLKQMIPAMVTALQARGLPIQSIQLKRSFE